MIAFWVLRLLDRWTFKSLFSCRPGTHPALPSCTPVIANMSKRWEQPGKKTTRPAILLLIRKISHAQISAFSSSVPLVTPLFVCIPRPAFHHDPIPPSFVTATGGRGVTIALPAPFLSPVRPIVTAAAQGSPSPLPERHFPGHHVPTRRLAAISCTWLSPRSPADRGCSPGNCPLSPQERRRVLREPLSPIASTPKKKSPHIHRCPLSRRLSVQASSSLCTHNPPSLTPDPLRSPRHTLPFHHEAI